MLRIPELNKTKSPDSGGRKGPTHVIVKNVNSDICLKRFKLIGVKSLVVNDVEKVSDTSYRFPVSDKMNMVFADALEVRDKVDKQMITKLFQIIKAAHMRGIVLGDINLRTICLNMGDGNAKIIDMSSSKLCVPGNHVPLGENPNMYHAPEVHSTGNVSFASDIYSLGLWWLVARTGSTVESWNLSCPMEINQHALATNPKFEILRRMLNVNPYFRPTIQEVIAEYHREISEANVVQEQLTASQSEVLRIFKGDSSVYSRLLDAQHYGAVVDSMPSILKHVFSYAPSYKSNAFKHSGNKKIMQEMLNLMYELLMNDKNQWENFVDGDFVEFHNMVLGFMSIESERGLLVAAKLREVGLCSFTSDFGVDAISLCKSIDEIKSLMLLLPQGDARTDSVQHVLSIGDTSINVVRSLEKRLSDEEAKKRELLADYDELWGEYNRIYDMLQSAGENATAVVKLADDASQSKKRRRDG